MPLRRAFKNIGRAVSRVFNPRSSSPAPTPQGPLSAVADALNNPPPAPPAVVAPPPPPQQPPVPPPSVLQPVLQPLEPLPPPQLGKPALNEPPPAALMPPPASGSEGALNKFGQPVPAPGPNPMPVLFGGMMPAFGPVTAGSGTDPVGAATAFTPPSAAGAATASPTRAAPVRLPSFAPRGMLPVGGESMLRGINPLVDLAQRYQLPVARPQFMALPPGPQSSAGLTPLQEQLLRAYGGGGGGGLMSLLGR